MGARPGNPGSGSKVLNSGFRAVFVFGSGFRVPSENPDFLDFFLFESEMTGDVGDTKKGRALDRFVLFFNRSQRGFSLPYNRPIGSLRFTERLQKTAKNFSIGKKSKKIPKNSGPETRIMSWVPGLKIFRPGSGF